MKSIQRLMQELMSGEVSHFNVFFGEEYYIMNTYIKKIADHGFTLVNTENTVVATQQAQKRSFIKQKKCFLVTMDEEFLTAENKWDKVKEIFDSSENILILKYTELNKTRKFFKHFKDNITEFTVLTDNLLVKYLQNDLEENVALDLIHTCHNNYGRILLELDKIKQVSKDNNTTAKQFLESGVIYKDVGDITFDFTDAVINGFLEPSNKLLYQINSKQNLTLSVLSILYNQFKNVLIIQGLGREKPTEDNTGLSNKQIYVLKKKCGAYSLKELVRALKVIRQTEVDIKTGKIDDDIALDYCVLNILK